MSMLDDVDRPAVGLSRAAERLRSQTFTGRDPENLVTALVDGDGMVDRITFATTITGRRPQAVASAVLAAIVDARRRSVEALTELSTARDSGVAATGPPAPDGIVGGLADPSSTAPDGIVGGLADPSSADDDPAGRGWAGGTR
jgi:DNA-binding protein YbaB